MLCIDNIRFLCKIQGLLDRVNSPETVLRIIMDNHFILPQLQGKTKQNLTDWAEHSIPPIELSPYQQTYQLQFNIYREGLMIGTGKTVINYGSNKKQCVDTFDSQSSHTGKLVYQANWVSPKGASKYITYQQYCAAKDSFKTQGGKQIIVPKTILTERSKKYVPTQKDQNFGGFCACFAVRKKRPTQTIEENYRQDPTPRNKMQRMQRMQRIEQKPIQVDPIAKFRHHPQIYFEQDLQQGKISQILHLNRLTYYSKQFVKSK